MADGLRARLSPSSVAMRRAPLRHALVLLALASSGFAATEAVLAADAAQEHILLTAAYPVVGAGFVLIGAYAWLRRPANSTGFLLCITGLLILGATLSDVPGPAALTHSGLLLGEAPIAAILHVVFAFPSGRVTDRRDRRLVGALYTIVLVRQLPLVLVPGRDLESFRTTCSFVGAGVLVMAAAHLWRRVRLMRTGVAEQRALFAVYGYGMGLLLFFSLSARVLRPVLDFDAATLAAVQVAGLAVLPLVFAVGLLGGGFAWTRDLDELSTWLGAQAQDRAALRDVLAQVLGDPSLDVVFTTVGDWADDDVTDWKPGSSPGVVRIRGADGHDAGVTLTYDGRLFADPAPVEQAGRVVAVALERERLRIELLAEREALRTSRARVIEVGDLQRRRLAHDLHDVLQSRLTLAAMHAGRLAASADAALSEELSQLRDQLDALTTEMRHVVHGVMPALLMERGLPAAVEELVDRLPLPSHLEVIGAEDLPPVLATHSYFVLAEALTNAVRHAQATSLMVAVAQDAGELRLAVCDDGIGGVHPAGSSLRSIAERVEALEGRLEVHSPAGGGTTVEVFLPCGL